MELTNSLTFLSPKRIEKFWENFDRSKDCWIWKGAKNNKGYGQVRINYKCYLIHRLSFFYTKGYLDANRLICHTCNNRACGKPQHLFHGTAKDNTEDALRKGTLKPKENGAMSGHTKRNYFQ